jgi:putative endopeptidase
MKKTIILSSALLAVIFYACYNSEKKSETTFVDPITTHIDSSIAPGENFFLHANNSWFKNHPIPASEKGNGIFNTIQDTINESVRKICEAAAADGKAEKGSNKQKIGDLYSSGMDTATIEKTGIAPLKQFFDKIDAIKSKEDLINTIGFLYTQGIPSTFGFSVTRDEKKSSQYAVYITQPRLGLPDRDYYFNTDERTKNIRVEYQKHLAAIFKLIGMDEKAANESMNNVIACENDIAKSSRKMEDLRDPYKNYNKMSVAQLNKITPSIKWENLIQILGLKNVDSVVVAQPEYFKALEYKINDNPAPWKSYLKWNVINHYSDYLNKKITDQDFHFYSTILDGVKEQKPRWKIIVESTDASLGELIGQVYVAEYLPKGTKEKLLEIGENIREVFAEHIKKLDWMSDETKQKSLSKLKKLNMKVGYPDKWKDMSTLNISRNSYLENAINIEIWNYNFMLNKYGKPVNKDEWDMYPQTYNAYYDPTMNEIVVPACNIIVPGFEGRMPDDAVLYGIIGGSTFGHEITHGFDDQGSLYDENGNLSDWWTIIDRSRFVAKTKLIVEQFNNYVVLDSMHVRGENTQGENIADLGGVIMGYEAFKKTKQGQSSELINGYTSTQRYFLAYGYAWMVNRTDASLAKQIMSDVHSPAEFRINGPLSDIDEFYKAFNIKAGDKMYRDEKVRVKIW